MSRELGVLDREVTIEGKGDFSAVRVIEDEIDRVQVWGVERDTGRRTQIPREVAATALGGDPVEMAKKRQVEEGRLRGAAGVVKGRVAEAAGQVRERVEERLQGGNEDTRSLEEKYEELAETVRLLEERMGIIQEQNRRLEEQNRRLEEEKAILQQENEKLHDKLAEKSDQTDKGQGQEEEEKREPQESRARLVKASTVEGDEGVRTRVQTPGGRREAGGQAEDEPPQLINRQAEVEEYSDGGDTLRLKLKRIVRNGTGRAKDIPRRVFIAYQTRNGEDEEAEYEKKDRKRVWKYVGAAALGGAAVYLWLRGVPFIGDEEVRNVENIEGMEGILDRRLDALEAEVDEVKPYLDTKFDEFERGLDILDEGDVRGVVGDEIRDYFGELDETTVFEGTLREQGKNILDTGFVYPELHREYINGINNGFAVDLPEGYRLVRDSVNKIDIVGPNGVLVQNIEWDSQGNLAEWVMDELRDRFELRQDWLSYLDVAGPGPHGLIKHYVTAVIPRG